MNTAEERIDGSVAYTSLVRYDAYNEMSGRQSSSVAFLDSHRTGVVVTSIAHRDQARVYVKQLHHGSSEVELSPEEQEAVDKRHGRRPRRRLMRVGYLGPAGTYSEEALRASAPAGVEEVPCASVYETVMAVHDGTVDRAVVPIENALEGGVAATLDALAGDAGDVRIAAEVVHPIHHCLVAATDMAIEHAITRGVPPAGERPVRALPSRAPGHAERAGAPSTADAVLTVSRENGEPSAALASRLAAELYGCRVLAENVEDRADNVTRFVWLARADVAVRPGPARQDLVRLLGRRRRVPGLAGGRSCAEFADRGMNMTRIESRPRQGAPRPLHVLRRCGGGGGPPARERGPCRAPGAGGELRVLGSYPSATGEPNGPSR